MKTISQYWSLVRLASSGKVQITELPSLKQFFQQQFSDPLPDQVIQKDLMILKNSQNELSILAERCLRCFISHQIRQVCIQLDMRFGREHGFSRQDLFIYTLNDTLDNFRDGVKPRSQYQPLAAEILATFDPTKANLTTWTSRCVKQNRELQRFLLEQGVYLISDWAILNDTQPKQLQRILDQFHHLTPTEIKTASILLTAYHQVYRSDRLKSPQGKGVKCQTPTAEQLERIASLINQKSGLVLSVEQTLSELAQLASLLREYRIYVRGGQRKQESLDNAEINTAALEVEAVPEEATADTSGFLQAYQQQFQQSLDGSIETVIQTRLSKFKGKKATQAPHFLTALELFHCQGESMGAIAPQVGLQAQFQVSRLLKLKELRADIRQTMLQQILVWTMANSQSENLTSLKARENEIELALGEQIDLVLNEAEKEATIADSTSSILAKRICDYLDRCWNQEGKKTRSK